MLVLFETPAGYALFKAKDGRLGSEDLHAAFATPELASEAVKLAGFYKFSDTTDALAGVRVRVCGCVDV